MYTRIKQVLDYSGLNQQEFAERIAIAPATLSNLLKGKTAKYSTDMVMSIVAAFPEIDMKWLMSGNGDMCSPIEGAGTTGTEGGSGVENSAAGSTDTMDGGFTPGTDGSLFPGFNDSGFSGDATFAYKSATPTGGADFQSGRKTVSTPSGNNTRVQTGGSPARGGAASQFVPGIAHANGSPMTLAELSQLVSHISMANLPQNIGFQQAKIQDKSPRKIKEIRIFYDDDTFEVFSPSK